MKGPMRLLVAHAAYVVVIVVDSYTVVLVVVVTSLMYLPIRYADFVRNHLLREETALTTQE